MKIFEFEEAVASELRARWPNPYRYRDAATEHPSTNDDHQQLYALLMLRNAMVDQAGTDSDAWRILYRAYQQIRAEFAAKWR